MAAATKPTATKLTPAQAKYLAYGWAPESVAKALERKGAAVLGACERRYPLSDKTRGARWGYVVTAA